jgi:hypothetical protein
VRRLLVLTVIAISSLGFSTAAIADHGDVAKPLCADLSEADFFYNPLGFVSVNITTAEPSCRGVTYTIFVEVDPDVVVSSSARGNGTTNVAISSPTFTDADGNVCAYVTSSRGGKEGQNQPFDRLPNIGEPTGECVELIPGGTGGGPSHG